VLVLGGARSGKSTFAESLVADVPVLDYVAPGAPPSPDDPEWAARVRAHQQRRPAGWRTVETLDLAAPLDQPTDEPVLIDCLSTWLAGAMDLAGIWAGAGDGELAQAVDDTVRAWSDSPRRAVAVSSEVGFGIVPATASGRRYRDELGRLNQRIAAVSDQVWLVVAGLPVKIK
jgi:adenosylcobinamide kinase/adenosylcobinamide-phosphate guanylyltransferase